MIILVSGFIFETRQEKIKRLEEEAWIAI